MNDSSQNEVQVIVLALKKKKKKELFFPLNQTVIFTDDQLVKGKTERQHNISILIRC